MNESLKQGRRGGWWRRARRALLPATIVVLAALALAACAPGGLETPELGPSEPGGVVSGEAGDEPVDNPETTVKVCGDGVRQLGEQCDGSPANCYPWQSCNADCKCQTETSVYENCNLNDVAEAGETCDGTDLGACQPGDSCVLCTCRPACGNGVVEPGENCEQNDLSNCVQGEVCELGACQCAPAAVCGDGLKEIGLGEQCEPPGDPEDCLIMWGDDAPSDTTCTDSCMCATSALCGNGKLEDWEQCEPGNPDLNLCAPGLACSPDCLCVGLDKPALCGNGTLEGVEECDGPQNTCGRGEFCQGCSCIGRLDLPLCGNGTVDSGEQCDGTDLTQCLSGQSCNNCQCVWVYSVPVCGNGIAESGEQCDVGDLTQCTSDQTCLGCKCVSIEVAPPAQGPSGAEGADGSLCGDGICQSGESGEWCGDCPAPGGDGGDGGDGGPPPPPSLCGNGVVNRGEFCDPPGGTRCGACNATCTGFNPAC